MTPHWTNHRIVPPALAGLLSLGLWLLSSPTLAHPHAWIDLRVQLELDTHGALQGMRQEWVFDPTYSYLLLQEMDALQPGLEFERALRAMSARMLGNLRDHDYFTEITVGGERIAIPEVGDSSLQWRQRRLHFHFELRFDTDEGEVSVPLEYRVYDPSYWIEILHDPHDVIHLDGLPGCDAQIESAQPERWLAAYAATLERERRGPVPDLGRSFAERVRVDCPRPEMGTGSAVRQ